MTEKTSRGRIVLGVGIVLVVAAGVFGSSYLSLTSKKALKEKAPVVETIQGDKKAENASCSCKTLGATIKLLETCEKSKKEEVGKALGLYEALDKENKKLRLDLDEANREVDRCTAVIVRTIQASSSR